MANPRSLKTTKNKSFSFRISSDLADDIASVKAKCKQHGIKINFSAALTKTLEKEILLLQRHIQNQVDENWKIRQSEIELE